MRPLKLEIVGFKPFKEKQIIDFHNLDFFVIRGPTGAGKSSILDAILYTLYGNVSQGRLNKEEIINKDSPRMKISFEFSVGGKIYRIERSASRRGSSESRFYVNNRPTVLRTSDIPRKVKEILGVDEKQFRTLFYLPQGQYDNFLKGSAGDRRQILMDLLDLEIYEDLAQKIRDELRNRELEFETLNQILETLKEYTEEHLEELKRELKLKEEESERLKQILEEKAEKYQQLANLEEKYRRLKEIEEQIKEFPLEKIENLRKEVEYLEKLLPLKGDIKRYLRLEEEIGELQKDIEGLKERLKEISEKEWKLTEEGERLKHQKELLEEEKPSAEKYKQYLAYLEGKKKELKRLAVKQEELKNEKQNLKKLAELLKRKEKEKQNLETQLQELLEELKEKGLSYEDYEKLQSLLPLAERKELTKQRLNELINEKNNLLKDLGKITEQIAELQKRKEKLLKKREELEKLEREFLIYQLTKDLNEGEPCPICGNPITSKKHISVTEGFDSELYERVKKELEKIEKLLTEYQTRHLHSEESLQQIEEKIKKLEKELKNLENIPSKVEITEKINFLNEKERKKRQIEERINGLTAEISGLNSKLLTLKENIDKLQEEIDKEKELAKGEILNIANSVGFEFPEKKIKVSLLEDFLRKKVENHEKRLKEYETEKEKYETLLKEHERTKTALLKELQTKEEQFEKLKGEILQIENLLRERGLDLQKLPLILKELEKFDWLKSELQRLERKINELTLEKANLEKSLVGFSERDLEELDRLEGEIKSLERERERLNQTIGSLRQRIEQTEEKIEEKREKEKIFKELEKKLAILRVLERDFGGRQIQQFVVSKALEDIVELASDYFWKLSERYRFVLENEDIAVLDLISSAKRSVKTLSGGETFLASLSFALGLGDYLGRNAKVESLFIDEGFGTLDKETLSKLEDLFEVVKERINKTVGIITHLDELASLFEKQIVVTKTPQGSKIEVVNGD
jgi:exonuclease SbcC